MAGLGSTATAMPLIGNLGVRAVSKMTPSYSGALIAGVSSTAFFFFSVMTDEAVIRDSAPNVREKRSLYTLSITLIGGVASPYLFSRLTKSPLSLIASVAYSILGYPGTQLGIIVLQTLYDNKPFVKTARNVMNNHLDTWNYLIGRGA